MAKGKKYKNKETEQEDFRLLKKPKKINKQSKKGRLSHKKVDPDNWEEYLN